MSKLIEYIHNHTKQVSPDNGIDLIFMGVSSYNKPEVTTFKTLIYEHIPVFGDALNLFDGVEHNFIEIGVWLGDQRVALLLMGLGETLGMWSVMTPKTVMDGLEPDVIMQMASDGLVTIQASNKTTIGEL